MKRTLTLFVMLILVSLPAMAAIRTHSPDIKVKRAQVFDEYVDDYELQMQVDLQGDAGSADAKVSIMVPDLGVRRSFGFDRIKKGHETSREFMTELPEDALPGEYVVRISVYGEDGQHRTRHRFFYLE